MCCAALAQVDFDSITIPLPAVLDYDKVTQDSANSKTFKATFNNADHLHPNDTGYKAMADSVDLKIFNGKKK